MGVDPDNVRRFEHPGRARRQRRDIVERDLEAGLAQAQAGRRHRRVGHVGAAHHDREARRLQQQQAVQAERAAPGMDEAAMRPQRAGDAELRDRVQDHLLGGGGVVRGNRVPGPVVPVEQQFVGHQGTGAVHDRLAPEQHARALVG